ncbi:hypothetical protein PV325_007824 [Microctonus aethiopoides]|nr:hypothetical protein PV325_007824 [Microctonus aethiopoides]
MRMQLTGLDDNEPLHPTGVKPNLAKLRIIKEEDMRKGDILGFGAFGNVYKGIWFCESENMNVPVAIKVLHSGTGANTSKEFLDEAYIMASVEHPNLVKLLAVCMTSQMMLITQLVPHGCLLDFVRNYKNKIVPKSLLNWSTQIARGMAYLEERRLVHRDLAARNVLVQHSNCVKRIQISLETQNFESNQRMLADKVFPDIKTALNSKGKKDSLVMSPFLENLSQLVLHLAFPTLAICQSLINFLYDL